MSDKTDFKGDIAKGLSQLETLRDEVRVRLHLAGMELRDEWHALEPHLDEVERSAKAVGEAARSTLMSALERLHALHAKLK